MVARVLVQAPPPEDQGAVETLCDNAVLQFTPQCQLVGAVRTAGEVLDFAQNPLGYIAQQMQAAATSLSTTILPELQNLTQPDLSADWFRSAYQVSFALGLTLWAVLVMWNFAQLSRHRVSGDDVVESLGLYSPLFIGGVIFGPIGAAVMLELAGAASTGLTMWGITGTAGDTVATLIAAIAEEDLGQFTGGYVVAIIVFACMTVSLLLVFLLLLVLLVTQYFTGAILPIGLAWIVNPRQRRRGLVLVMVWVGLNFSHVMIFLMLSIAFRMINGLSTDFDEPGVQRLANLAVAIIALLVVTFAPLGLLKYANAVSPTDAPTSTPKIPSQRSGGSGPKESPSDSQAAQLARSTPSSEPARSGAGGGGGDLGTASPSGGGQGLLTMAAQQRGAGPSATAGLGGEDSASGAAQQAPTSGAGTPAGTGSGGAGASSTPASPPLGADAGAGAGAGTGAGAAAGAGTGAGAAAGAGTAATAGAGAATAAGAGAATAAGAAATATGVGAVVGVPLIAAAAATKTGVSAVAQAAELAGNLGEAAGESMVHGKDDGFNDRGTRK